MERFFCPGRIRTKRILTNRNRMGIWLVAVFTLVIAGCAGTETVVETADEAQPATRITVRLSVNFNGRSENSAEDIEVPDDTSVFGILAKGFPGEVEHSGQGERLFVRSIRGVANEGPRGDNWTYRVNGELGKVSSGICPVADGNVVEWTLGKYSPED
ncbi:MAG: DUF4430 domain-containing protein [Pirellulaceae bacterium]|jgi:hypothetical protein|nr:DUF4430 domain-containing protein [Pirellulaceae bacterium]